MSAPPVSVPLPVAVSLSPTRRAWRRFRAHRLGFASLVLFVALFALSLVAELVSNDKPQYSHPLNCTAAVFPLAKDELSSYACTSWSQIVVLTQTNNLYCSIQRIGVRTRQAEYR